MPQIPQAIDYGARPSLRTNRVDRPSGANVLVADALVSAASTFQGVLAENKAKEDRLNYSLARNEIQIAELEIRDSLADDKDWQSHDEKYSGLFTTARDEILGRYNLSPNDKTIMAAENDLIHAQGRVSVGDNSRKLEIDEARGRYLTGKATARASLVGQNAQTRNNIILGQLDVIEAQVEKGFMTEEQGAAEREAMTQDFALSVIEAMPVEERIRVLEQTLAGRKGYKEGGSKYDSGIGPLDADAIRGGFGTGSTADFLHADTAAKMLVSARKGDEVNQNRIAAYTVTDTAMSKYRENPAAARKYVRDNTEGSVRAVAESKLEQLIAQQDRALAASRAATHDDFSKRIAEGEHINDMIATEFDSWDELSAGTQAALDKAQKMKDLGKLYADRTIVKDPGDGSMSLEFFMSLPQHPTENSAELAQSTVDLSSAEWATALDQSGYGVLKGIQNELITAEGSFMDSDPRTPKVMVTEALALTEVVPRISRNPAQESMALRLELRLEARILAEQNESKPPKELTQVRKNAILNELMGQSGEIDVFWGGSETIPIHQMTPDQIEEAFEPIAYAKSEKVMLDGDEVTMEDFLRAKAGQPIEQDGAGMNQIVPEANIERAHWALKNGLGMAEVIRRLRGE